MGDKLTEKDVVIVGAGPAGLTSAIYTQLDGWDTLVLEGGWVGGQGSIAYTVMNYPGYPPGDGRVLMEIMEKQVTLPLPDGVGAELKKEKALEIDPDELIITTESNRYKAQAIILATGSRMLGLGIPGEKEFIGKGVSYYAVRDLDKFAGKKVLLVGGGNATAKSALISSSKASEVTLIHRRDCMRAYQPMVNRLKKEEINVRYDTAVKEIKGRDEVESVVLSNLETGREEEIEIDWVVICVGTEPDTELVIKTGLEMNGEIVRIDDHMQTSRKGIFACGEIASNYHHLINAASEGACAGMCASEYLALEKVKRGELFDGAVNGKYADEYAAMLKS